jgi:hypothetical protein
MSNYTHFEYKAGLSQVGQYQASGVPYATSSLAIPPSSSAPIVVSFPRVTKFFTVVNTATGSLRVGFSALGTTGSAGGGTNNYFLLTSGQNYTAEIKVSKLFLLGHTIATSASVIAGLTGIETGSLQNNWSGSIGVG